MRPRRYHWANLTPRQRRKVLDLAIQHLQSVYKGQEPHTIPQEDQADQGSTGTVKKNR